MYISYLLAGPGELSGNEISKQIASLDWSFLWTWLHVTWDYVIARQDTWLTPTELYWYEKQQWHRPLVRSEAKPAMFQTVTAHRLAIPNDLEDNLPWNIEGRNGRTRHFHGAWKHCLGNWNSLISYSFLDTLYIVRPFCLVRYLVAK